MKKILLFLFVVLTIQFGYAQTELIIDGNFSTMNSAWIASGDFHYGQTYTNCPCGTPPCTGYAYLSTSTGGVGNNLFGDMEQYVTIPAGGATSATLSICYNGTGTETITGNDVIQCGISLVTTPYTFVSGPILSIVGNVSGTTSSFTITSAMYPTLLTGGAQLHLIFEASTNETLASTIRLDNVSFTYIACTPPTTPTISGTTTICSGQSTTLSVSNPCSGCTYSWSNGGSGTSISVTTAGAYTATAHNSCGNSSPSNSLNVTVNPSATTPTITGNTSICSGQSTTLSVSNPCSGCTYSWSNGGSGQNISVNNAGTYTATANNNCGTSSQSNSLNVTVSPAPTTPTISGNTTICSGQSTTLTVSNTCSGCNYTWSNGGSGTSISVSTAGTYTATASNSCSTSGTSNSLTVTVNPSPTTPVIISQGNVTSFCQGAGSATLQVTNTCTGCNYTWYPSGSGTSNIVTNAGNYYCTSSNTCGGPSAQSNSIQITVNTVPVVSFSETGNELVYNFTDNSTGSPTTWNWNFGDPSSEANNTSTLQNPQHTFSGTGTFNVSLLAINSCGFNSSNHDVNVPVSIDENKKTNIKNITITPNPVSNSALIKFTIIKREKISISLCNISGKKISIISESDFNPGEYSIVYERPEKLSSGTYFIKFVSEDFSKVQKIVFN